EHFLARACEDYSLASKTLAADARAALLAYPWPGNVRQLANVMERAALFTDAQAVTADALGLGPVSSDVAVPSPGRGVALEDAMRDVERAHLVDALEGSGGNITRAAARLGLPRNTLRYRLARHKLGLDEGSARRRGGRPPGSRVPLDRPVAAAPPSGPAGGARRLTLPQVALVSPRPGLSSAGLTRALGGIMGKGASLR